jgi:hypothetical protein
MKHIPIALLCGWLLVGVSLAQSSAQSDTSASQQGTVSAGQNAAQAQSSSSVSASQQAKAASPLPAGSVIYAELSKSVDAKKAKQGDEVSAKTTQAVLAQGKVVIPKGSKLLGHVTQVQVRSKEQAHSELGIAFDHAVLKDGTQIPIAVTIQAIGSVRVNPAFENQNEYPAMGSGSGMPSAAGSTAPGRPGGVMGTAGSTVGGVANTAGGVAGTVAGDTAGIVGGGHLDASSRGVVGLPNLTLSASASSSAQGSVIASDKGNVKLDSGTELVLRANP